MRAQTLPLVVDNPRFLLLPWIASPTLGAHLLALVRRRLPADGTPRDNPPPVLLEPFVQPPRSTGAGYRASGWTHGGPTPGRGRYDPHRKRAAPRKDIWLSPLRKNWQQTLNR